MSDRLSLRAALGVLGLLLLALLASICLPERAEPAERELVVVGQRTPHKLVLYFQDEQDLCAWAMQLKSWASDGARLSATYPRRVGDHWEMRE